MVPLQSRECYLEMTVDDVYLVDLQDGDVGPQPGPGLPPLLDDGGVVLRKIHL